MRLPRTLSPRTVTPTRLSCATNCEHCSRSSLNNKSAGARGGIALNTAAARILRVPPSPAVPGARARRRLCSLARHMSNRVLRCTQTGLS